MTTLLFWVFASHFPFFAWRYHKTRELRFAATACTFALLAVTYGVRLWAPEASLAGTALHTWLRVPALVAAALSLGLLARHLLGRG
jgi:hypothetical protein